MTIDLFERYAALDPAKSPGIQPEWSAMAPVPLSTLDGREPDMQTQQETPQQPRPSRKRRTGLLLAAIAVAVVLVVGAVAVLNSGGDSNLAPADAPTTPTTVPADANASVSTSDALTLSNAYFVAYNAGDVDGVMALFAPGAKPYRSNFGGDLTFDEATMLYTWNAAQGTILTSQGCTATEGVPGRATSMSCVVANHDALVQAVDAPPVTGTVEIRVTPEGITLVGYVYGDPDFNDTGTPFDRWMQTNNPADAERTAFGNWTTIEEAQEYGELTARYAEEWATYLADNNCSYKDGC